MVDPKKLNSILDAIFFSLFFFFFFKQKTAYEIYQCDWSSDVCSSDLNGNAFLFDRLFQILTYLSKITIFAPALNLLISLLYRSFSVESVSSFFSFDFTLLKESCLSGLMSSTSKI